jgi:hypothetical protein
MIGRGNLPARKSGKSFQDSGSQAPGSTAASRQFSNAGKKNPNKCLATEESWELDLLLILELHLFWEPSRVLCQSAMREAEL